MICPNCRQDVEGKWVDEGIGRYEFWGVGGVDKQIVFVCENCDAELESEQSYEDHLADLMEDYGKDDD